MSSQLPPSSDSINALNGMLHAALTAYEQAKATRMQLQLDADDAQRLQSAAANAAVESANRNAQQAFERAEILAVAEQARIRDLIAVADNLEEAAKALMDKAGLAYIAGAPLSEIGKPSSVHLTDSKVTESFTAAHTAFVELRTSLVALARTHS